MSSLAAVIDPFVGPNGQSLSGRFPSQGDAWIATTGGGSPPFTSLAYQIEGNSCVRVDVPGYSNFALEDVQVGGFDASVQVTLPPSLASGGGAGVLGNCSWDGNISDTTGWLFWINTSPTPSAGQLNLSWRSGGFTNVFSQPLMTSPGDSHVLRLTRSGNLLTGYLDGMQQFSISDARGANQTFCGMYSDTMVGVKFNLFQAGALWVPFVDSAAVVIQELLIQAGQASDPTVLPIGQWPIYKGVEPPPTATVPGEIITVYATQGLDQGRTNPDGQLMNIYGFQLRIRSNDDVDGKAKLESIREWMSRWVDNYTITLASGTTYFIPAIVGIGQVLELSRDRPPTGYYICTLNAQSAIRAIASS